MTVRGAAFLALGAALVFAALPAGTLAASRSAGSVARMSSSWIGL